MSAVAALHQAALDGAIWASTSPRDAVECMGDELEALIASEHFTPHQHTELTGLLWALRTLADRLEVVS